MNINVKNDPDTGESIYVFKFNDETDFDNFKNNVQRLTENISSKSAAKNLSKAMNELFDRVSFEKPGSDVLRAEASDISFMRMFASLFSSSLWNRKVSDDREERLRSEKEEYRSRLSAVKHELSDQIRSLEKDNTNASKRLAEADAKTGKLNEAVRALSAELKRVQSENENLKNELYSAERESRALTEKFQKQEEARRRKAKENADEGNVTLDFDSSAVDLEDIPDMDEPGDSRTVFTPRERSLEETAAHNAKMSRGDDFARQMAIDLAEREKASTVTIDDSPMDDDEPVVEERKAASAVKTEEKKIQPKPEPEPLKKPEEKKAPEKSTEKPVSQDNGPQKFDLFADIDASMFDDDDDEDEDDDLVDLAADDDDDDDEDYLEEGKKKKGLLSKMFG